LLAHTPRHQLRQAVRCVKEHRIKAADVAARAESLAKKKDATLEAKKERESRAAKEKESRRNRKFQTVKLSLEMEAMLERIFESCDVNHSKELSENELAGLAHSNLLPFYNWMVGGSEKRLHHYTAPCGALRDEGMRLAIHTFCCEDPRFVSFWAELELKKANLNPNSTPL